MLRLRRGRSATVNIGAHSGQFSALGVDNVDTDGLHSTQVDAADTVVSRASSRRITVEDSDTESLESEVDSMLDVEPKSPEIGEVEDEVATHEATLQFGAVARAALEGLDRVNFEADFTTRACIMKSSPRS